MRYVLVDRFLELEQGKRARAVKCVTRGEPFVAGLDAYPPTLVLEALLQAGGALARSGAPKGARTVLGKVERAEFPAAARAGDRIVLDVETVLSRPEGTLCTGVATVDGNVVGKAEFMIVFLPEGLGPPEAPEIRERRRLLARALGLPAEGA
jgi:3-hydroxyacyl-[acyl-carrier-protein] dehydratase